MRDKYQEEIEEILRKAGEAAPSDPAKESSRNREERPRSNGVYRSAPAPRYRPRPRRLTLTPGKLMLGGLILFLIGLLVTPLLWLGLGCLVGGYLLYFLRPRAISSQETQEKRWRGHSVEDVHPSPWRQLKRWFKG
jgi:hypothetical protein